MSKTRIYSGRVISLDIEQVELPNGTSAQLEIIRHPGGAAIVALDHEQRVCLLRQYRHAVGDWLWELPAGKIDHGEPPLRTAHRELEEEAGVTAASWHSLGEYLSSPGVFTEVVHLFLARELATGAGRPESTEVFEVHWLRLDAALTLAARGIVRDGKSVVALFRAARWLEQPAAV